MLKPLKGESKQAFFKRAVSELKKQGKKVAAAIAEASRIWNSGQNLSAGKTDHHDLVAPVQFDLAKGDAPEGESGEAKPRTFGILAYAGGVIDLGYYKFIISIKGIQTKTAFPCLYEHDRSAIAGTSTKVTKKNNEFFCHGKFHDTAEAAHILKLADDDFPWQASMGIWPVEVRYLERDKKAKINGVEVVGPLDIWEMSDVKEISICSLGADDNTAAIAMHSCPTNNSEFSMKYSQALKLALGLAADADSAAVEKELAAKGITLSDSMSEGDIWIALHEGGHVTLGASAADPAPSGGAEHGADIDALVEQKLAAKRKLDNQRAADIRQVARKLGLPDSFAAQHIELGTSKEEALELAVELASKRNATFGAHSLADGVSESDKIRLLAVDGICYKLGLKHDADIADGARQFAGMSLLNLAGMMLSRSGKNPYMLSPDMIAREMLGSGMRLDASRADFVNIFRDVANVAMLQAFNEHPVTWEPFVKITSASNFKEIHGVNLSEAGDLEPIAENAVYPVKALKDSGEKYAVGKYGEIVRLSYEMIVDDNLRAFLAVPQMFGDAARRKQSDLVYERITSNPVMADGVALFHDTHGNYCPMAKAGKIDSASLSAGRLAMRQQKGLNNARLDIRPSFLLVPSTLETDAEVMLRSAAAPEANNSGVKNIWQNSLTPISEPRLDDHSINAWYLLAAPNRTEGIEMAFLDGRREPELFEDDDFDTDGVKYKTRIVVGVGVMGHRFAYKNDGVVA